MIRAVVFDLDGVIMKFKLDSLSIKKEVIAYLEGEGLPAGALSPTEPFSKIKDSARGMFLSQGKDPAWVEAAIRKGEGIPVRHEIEAANNAELLPSARETLAALKGQGLRLAIFTYNNSRATDIALTRFGLREYFDVVASRDSVPRPKPNPLHLEFILQSLGIERGEAVVVGDSEMDIKPCKELGVRVVAISTGIRSAEFLRGQEPDHLIGDLAELQQIVDSLS